MIGQSKQSKGITLVELLIASGLFFLLTLLVAYTLNYAYSKGTRLDQHQERIQEFIIFRERALTLLRNAKIKAADSSPEGLAFVLPRRRATAVGDLDKVNDAEQTEWNEDEVFQISADNSENGYSILLNQIDQETGDVTALQVLWKLDGLSSDLQFDLTQLPVLKVIVSSQADEKTPRWTRELVVVVADFV